MIQLLYGNNGVNYAEIARSSNLSTEQYSELYKSYLGYPLAVDPELYGKKEEEPIAYNILVTNLSGKLQKDMLMLSKKAKMCSYETPCYYAHLQLLDIEEEMLKTDFKSLFKYDFIDESEIPGYHNGLIEGDGREKEYSINDKALREDQIKASLYLLYRNIDSWTKKVTIIIDTDGFGYNQRALDIVASIYKRIPWPLRKLVGFTTYSTPDVKEPAQIKIRIMPRWCLERCDEEEVLDFRKKDLLDSAAVRNVPEQIRRFADGLWKESEEENRFVKLWKNFKDFGSLKDYMDYCDKVKLWNEVDIKEHFKEIMEYFIDEKNQGKTEYQEIKSVIENRIGQKIYNDIMREDIKQAKGLADFFEKYKQYASFTKAVSCKKLNTNFLAKWFEKRILPEMLKEQNLQIKYDSFIWLSDRMGKKDLGFIKEDVKRQWEKNIQEEINTLKEELETKKDRERKRICIFINHLYRRFNVMDVKEKYRNIQYKEDNEMFFQRKLYRFFCHIFDESIANMRKNNYLKVEKLIKECREVIEEHDYKDLNERLERMEKEIVKRRALLDIVWNTRDDIKMYYVNRTQIRILYRIEEGMKDENVVYTLTINGKKFHLEEKQMDDITDYLLNETEKNQEKAERVFDTEKDLSEELEKNGFIHWKKKGLNRIFRNRRKKVKGKLATEDKIASRSI